VYLAKPAFKASFIAGYCLRPQGHQNGLIQKLTKYVFFIHLYPKMFKILAIQPENGFLCAPHQITASAYLVRDDAVLRYVCHFYGCCNYTKLGRNVQ